MTPPIDRRTFLAASAAATLPLGRAIADEPTAKRWKKAFMLGQSEGPILPTFRLLREAGFAGVELVSPNKLDASEVLKARDETGLVIHGVSGSVHWSSPLSSPDPSVVEKGLAAIRKEIEDVTLYGGTTVLVVPAVVNKEVSHREAFERSQRHLRTLIPLAERARGEAGDRGGVEQVPPQRPRDGGVHRLVPQRGRRRLFRRGERRGIRLPPGVDRELGKRILKIHIKEYAKPKRFSYSLGEGGEIDWKAVVSALRSVGYDGWITAEVGWATSRR